MQDQAERFGEQGISVGCIGMDMDETEKEGISYTQIEYHDNIMMFALK